jgi:hypothetical protein
MVKNERKWGCFGLNPGPDTEWNVGYYIAGKKYWKLLINYYSETSNENRSLVKCPC